MSETPAAEPKKWYIEPESEYRFELDAGTSLAIKVCLKINFRTPQLTDSSEARSWQR